MLDRGIKFFTDLEGELKGKQQTTVTADKAFFLYDTLGFPIDLTVLMAEEAGLEVDHAGFERELEAQKQRSRDARNAARSGGAQRLELIAEQTAWLADHAIVPTDDNPKYKWDVETMSSVQAIFGTEGFLIDGTKASKGDRVGLILDKSAFYGEAGGQEADIGSIAFLSEDGERTGAFTVTEVQAYAGFLLHSGVVEEGSVEVGASVKCLVDYERRRDVAPNHSMTHVLNAALRQVLGDAVEQRGSLCNDEKLRFDFSHKKAMNVKQLRETEDICKAAIAEAQAVTSQVMPLEEAKAIDGVRAVFGEVYPDPVRVVTVGSDTSVEFCGGTHVDNTAEAQAFALVEETAVAKGIRRITAVTKNVAIKAIEEGAKFESMVAEAEGLSADSPGLDKKAGALRKELDAAFVSAPLKADLRAKIEVIQKKGIEANKAALAQRVDKCLNVVKEEVEAAMAENKRVLVLNVDIGADSKASQKVMNAVKKTAPDMAFMGISEEEMGTGGKVMAFCIVPDAILGDGLNANEWVKAALESCGGRGGGKPGSAQGQAGECSDIEAVLAEANSFATEKLGAITT
eukprot:scaffold250627_cov46-Attheya_sp.AAC.4